MSTTVRVACVSLVLAATAQAQGPWAIGLGA